MQRINLAVLGGQSAAYLSAFIFAGPHRVSDRALVPDLFGEGFNISSDLLLATFLS